MATAAEQDNQELPQKDFATAVKIWRQDIKPAATQQGVHGQEQSTAYKEIKKSCHIQPGAAKLAFKVAEMEEAHRDDFLICLNGLFKELKITMPRDLVTMADGEDGGSIIPEGEREQLDLVGIDDDGEDADSDEAGDADEFEEASEEEIAAQKPRAEEAEKKGLRRASVSQLKAVEPPVSAVGVN